MNSMFSFFEKRLNPFPSAAPKIVPKSVAAFFWEMTKGSRHYFVAVLLFTAAIGAFEAILFSFLGQLVDWLAAVKPDQLWRERSTELLTLAGVLAGSIVLVALQAVFKYQVLYSNFPMLLRWNFHRWMLSQSMSFYQDEFAGRVATKVMQTALATRDVLILVSDIAIYVVIYFATMTSLMGGFASILLWPFLGWAVAYAFVVRFFVPRIGQLGERQADARSLMTGRITDAYSNITTVKLFSHGEREAGYAKESMREFLSTAYPQMRLSTSFEIVNHVLSMILILSTCGLVLWLWSQGKVGLGAVAASCAMAMRLNGISHWVMWELAGLFENLGTVRDGVNMLSKVISVVDAPDAKPLVVSKGTIDFVNVGFAYTKGKPILQNLNLHIAPGERIGLVGPSGAGKSTLTNLLQRFYDVQSGAVLIDGQNVAQVTMDSLRANIGMVTQDTSLLHRSMRENLAYGRPDASDTAIAKAAARAQAAQFIEQLEDGQGRTGYEAHVGERGVKLSGGQRQRVAIARVVLKDAPLLILDEATSALDSEVEAAIQQSLNTLMEGKTVIAIAHRLSTIAAMDRLLVMDKGEVVEQGTHTQLLAANGLYARLWQRQSGGFLGVDG
jgi:ATP-binding cassette, subfamily B, multidrug efflux pump